ncbi:3-hydroxyacyl-CoA dehydrogenase/enoyl-CoA hydratase family protein [Sandaracinus amylolyticus]|uniref:3-hydroxyacyl-CoA dehydrogenase/enoyl-CoA hydratase family protein n=1 Tax=Sandaracinus amylolyticus TaxID=927083 RepID=UPI001F42C977|nr:3-hydroxyacyl-CoA dehydrogenase/enoyl-CoA hydratase family protein [Sandaracinus amylolyticus]UJR78724.1 3-hydroxyacyl-CoA dehydrogenase / enoyl-CoA hydratase [Sandaracinus amylolyticus]
MAKAIRRVAVLGSGVMGSGIAAHMANAGLEVLLLDIVPKDTPKDAPKAKRDAIPAGALAATLKTRPAAFFHPSSAKLVSVGNLEDDLEKAGQCDLIVEAIIERLDIKRALFERLEKVVQPHTIVASNTSGLRIHDMVEGRSQQFKKNFLVMHFFNPVRYMKLLELVAGPETDPASMERIARFGRDKLGKGIVVGKDTPNFVGNRIGVHSMMTTIHLMLEEGLKPEDVDNITGSPMGHPRSASFGTADLVGLDTFVHVADNCFKALPEDEERKVFEVPGFIRQMVEKKLLGNKTKAGFYRRGKSKAESEAIDPATIEYRPKDGDEEIAKATKKIAKIEDPKERVRALVADQGKAGAFAWKVLARALAYSARRIGEITDDVVAIDDSMRWGYNWELGPFETWDALGFVETTDRMVKDGVALPKSILDMKAKGAKGFYREDGAVWDLAKGAYVARAKDPREVTLPQLRKGSAPVLQNAGAEAWDLGDGVLGVTFKTKANSIDPDVISMLHEASAKAEDSFRAMVIVNQGEHFCVGANLFGVVMAAQQGAWDQLRTMVKGYQQATQRMKYAAVPVVAAPYGMTLGGGLELCFGCDAVQAAAETYSGLVEVGVGLLPGGAGNLNMLWRALEGLVQGANVDTYAIVTQVFKNIALASVATSAVEAQQFGYFRKTDGVSFDRARQLHEAKQRAIGLAESGYHAPTPRAYVLPGENGIATLRMMVDTLVAGGHASEHDAKIATKVAEVLCGGAAGHTHEVTEQEILDLECEAFLSLCGEPKSQERMQYMLMNNKPLRN